MPDDEDLSYDLPTINARLAEIEKEKSCLLALKENLQKSQQNTSASPPLSPEQKIFTFKSLFRGRTDIFANRWQNQQGRSGYSVACNNEWIQGICNKLHIPLQDEHPLH